MIYEVCLHTSFYDILTVEADSPEEAEKKARLIEPVGGVSECECVEITEVACERG